MQYRINDGVLAVNENEAAFVEAGAEEIISYWADASDEVRDAGIEWYAGEGRALAERVTAETGLPLELSAAVVSSNSQRTSWARQVKTTSAFVQHILDGGDVDENCPKASTFWKTLERSAEIIRNGSAASIAKSPKLGAFLRNILGDYEVVTVDVWAMRVVLGRDKGEDELGVWCKGRRHQMLQAAYHLAAERIGRNVAEVQAAVWLEVQK